MFVQPIGWICDAHSTVGSLIWRCFISVLPHDQRAPSPSPCYHTTNGPHRRPVCCTRTKEPSHQTHTDTHGHKNPSKHHRWLRLDGVLICQEERRKNSSHSWVTPVKAGNANFAIDGCVHRTATMNSPRVGENKTSHQWDFYLIAKRQKPQREKKGIRGARKKKPK